MGKPRNIHRYAGFEGRHGMAHRVLFPLVPRFINIGPTDALPSEIPGNLVVQGQARELFPRLGRSFVHGFIIVFQIKVAVLDQAVDQDKIMRFVAALDPWEAKMWAMKKKGG